MEKTLESPFDCNEINPVHPKGKQSCIFIGGTDTKLQYFGHLIQRADSLEKTLMLGKIHSRRRRWEQQRTRWLDGLTDAMARSKLWEMVRDREIWRAALPGVAKSWTRLSD